MELSMPRTIISTPTPFRLLTYQPVLKYQKLIVNLSIDEFTKISSKKDKYFQYIKARIRIQHQMCFNYCEANGFINTLLAPSRGSKELKLGN
jgi:hypothetical protein